MQHKDIIDSERHELKGASTALVGTVPVSNGSGGTSFQKIGALSLAGAIPTSIPDRVVATDGSGGFKALEPKAFGSFELGTPLGDLPNIEAPSIPKVRYSSATPLITPVGLTCSGGILTVNVTANYIISAGSYVYTPPAEATPASAKSYFSALYNYSTGALVAPARSIPHGVFLEVSKQYVLEQGGDHTVIAFTIEKADV